jgi:hypothetical protein
MKSSVFESFTYRTYVDSYSIFRIGDYVTLFCCTSYLLKYLDYILIYTLDSFP